MQQHIPKIRLRRPKPEDREAFLTAAKRSLETLLPWVVPPVDDEAFSRLLIRSRKRTHRVLLVIDVSTKNIAGAVTINEIVRGNFQSAYMGYFGLKPFYGTGHMTEGVRQAVDYVFTKLGLHRLEANIQPGNLRSLALVRRLGFIKEGLSENYLKIGEDWRDHERWAIRAECWARTSEEYR